MWYGKCERGEKQGRWRALFGLCPKENYIRMVNQPCLQVASIHLTTTPHMTRAPKSLIEWLLLLKWPATSRFCPPNQMSVRWEAAFEKRPNYLYNTKHTTTFATKNLQCGIKTFWKPWMHFWVLLQNTYDRKNDKESIGSWTKKHQGNWRFWNPDQTNDLADPIILCKLRRGHHKILANKRAPG